MLYPYVCEKCNKDQDILKPASDSSKIEHCNQCGNELKRVWTRFQVIGASVQNAEYNPGLGCVVNNKRHRQEIAKQRDLIEVGSETPDTIYKEAVVRKQQEREKEWDKL